MAIFKNIKTISIVLLLIRLPVNAQISKSTFSVKVNYGYSFSRMTLQEDFNIKNGNILVLSPQFSYNILTNKKDIIEMGVGLFKVGNKIAYYDNANNMTNSLLNTNQVYGIPLSFYKNIDHKNNRFYLGLDTLICYNFSRSVFTNIYTDFTETTMHTSGFKVNLTTSMRYLFTVKQRNFSLELTYSKGLVSYYKVNIISNFYPTQNIINNNGSTLQLGVTYFFAKNQVEE